MALCSQQQLHPALADGPAASDAAALEAHPHLLAFDAGGHGLSLRRHGKTVADGTHLHRLAGGEPLAGFQRRRAHGLGRAHGPRQRAADQQRGVGEDGAGFGRDPNPHAPTLIDYGWIVRHGARAQRREALRLLRAHASGGDSSAAAVLSELKEEGHAR